MIDQMIDLNNPMTFKRYYETVDVFIMTVITPDQDPEEIIAFLELFQPCLEKLGHCPKVLINYKNRIRPNSINHCFLVQEQIDLHKWYNYCYPVEKCILIKDTKKYSPEELTVRFLNREQDDAYELKPLV